MARPVVVRPSAFHGCFRAVLAARKRLTASTVTVALRARVAATRMRVTPRQAALPTGVLRGPLR